MGAFREFFTDLVVSTKIPAFLEYLTDKVAYIVASKLAGNTNVQVHDKLYYLLPVYLREDIVVKQTWESRRAELIAEGSLTAGDAILNPLSKGIRGGFKAAAEGAVDDMYPIAEEFLLKQGLTKEQLEPVKKMLGSGAFGMESIVSFLLGVTLYPAISTATGPVWRIAEQQTNSVIRSALLSPMDLIRADWRGELSEAWVLDEFEKQGYKDEDITALRNISRFYPAPADFIRFMVRDTFNEEVVKRYQYDADYPKEINDYVAKAGLDPEWAKHYWRAHWDLPSPMQTFEMLHRRKITLEDAKTILRIADIAPYFIEPFIAIAYNPVTRVDLRRLYQTGEYTEEDVYNGYLDIGSSPENAKSLTSWTVKAYAPQEKELAKTEILKNYAIGQTTVEEVKRLLGILEYEEPEILWILTYEDYRLEVAAREEEAETIIAEVINGTKTLQQAEESFKALKVTQKTKTSYIERAKREVRKLQYRPPIATLKTWFEKGILTEAKFKERMSLMKVTEEDINNYILEGASE